MFEWIKNIFSGEVWLGVSKDEAVGDGIYRITFDNSSLLGLVSKLFTIGKVYSWGGYSFDITDLKNDEAGKIVLTTRTYKVDTKNQAGVGWYILLGGLGAAVLLSSIEKIEKLVDTTTTRTIQIGIVILLILIVWKFSRTK